MLLSAAHTEGSLVPSITYVVVPDTHPASAAGHIFTDNTAALVDAVSRRLSSRHLQTRLFARQREVGDVGRAVTDLDGAPSG